MLSMLERDPRGGDLLGCVPTPPAELPDRDTNVRIAIASTLIGGLELARDQHVYLRQEVAFGPIAFEARRIGSRDEADVDQVEAATF